MTPFVISELLLALICVAIIVAAFRFRPRYFVPDRIKQDRSRQIVVIDGIELSGIITKNRCEKCRAFLIYHKRYKVDFCPTCNEWAVPKAKRKGPVAPGWGKPVRPLPEMKT